jgi:hypothetical protein
MEARGRPHRDEESECRAGCAHGPSTGAPASARYASATTRWSTPRVKVLNYRVRRRAASTRSRLRSAGRPTKRVRCTHTSASRNSSRARSAGGRAAAFISAWSTAAGTKSIPSTGYPSSASAIARSPDPHPTSRIGPCRGILLSTSRSAGCGPQCPRGSIPVYVVEEIFRSRSEATHAWSPRLSS